MNKRIFALSIITLLLTMTTIQVRSQTTDVGVSALILPASPLCGGLNDIVVVITNYGTVDVNSLNLDWSVNGISQTQLSYVQSLLAGESDTLNLGPFDFPSASTSSVTAFTSSPNGSTDDDLSNDTLTAAGLLTRFAGGTYTIGGNTPDFARITDAVTALSTYGICGAVTFDIRSGIDTVKVAIPAVTGADSSNTILFRSEALNRDSVKLTAPSETGPANPNYVLRLDGADHITFQYMTLERSGTEPYARVIEFRGGACFNTIDNCLLKGSSQNQVANSLAAVIYSSFGTPTNDSDYTITDNVILNGSIGIYMNGLASLNPESGGVISGNTLSGQYGRGIAVSNQGGLVISRNTITTNSAYSQFSGIELDRSQRNQFIEKNRISGNVDIGINLIDCSGYNGTPGQVINNFIQSVDSCGMRMDNGEYQLVAYNSINMTNTSTGAAVRVSGIGLGNELLNNIFCNLGNGPAANFGQLSTIGVVHCDYNDLFAAGNLLGVYNGSNAADLPAWQNGTSTDSHSVSSDPYFSGIPGLYPTSIDLDGAASPISQVLDDIDGILRDAITPDIGAAEFAGTRHDLAATAILTPATGTCGSTGASVTVVITNTGDAPATGFSWTVASIATGYSNVQTYTDTLAPGTTDTLVANTTINTSAGGTIDLRLSVDAARDDDRSNDTLNTTSNITPIPAAPVATADSVCLGVTSTLSAAGQGTIDWYDAATGGNLVATGNTYSPAPLNATTTFYASTILNGCEGPRAAATATIFPLPVVSLGSDQSIIQGNTATFDAGSGFFSYLWNTGATGQSIVVSDSGCYQVVVSNSFACTASDEACLSLVFPTDMYVNAVLDPISGLCASTSTPVMVQLVNNGPNTASNIPISVTVSGSTTATLSVSVPGPIAAGDSIQVSMGTINTSSGGNLTIDVDVNYNAEADPANDHFSATLFLPVEPALPSASDAGRCGPGAIILNATATLNVLWFDSPTGGSPLFAGNTYTIPNLSQTTVFYLQNGTFCIGQSRLPITASVFTIPVINLGPDTSTALPFTLDAGSGFGSYTWSNGEFTQTISVTQYGEYSVFALDQNGCIGADTITISPLVGIGFDNAINSLRVYPNPSTGLFTLDIPAGWKEDLRLEVVGVSGTRISTETIRTDGQGGRSQIDCSGFAKGIYFLKISTETSLRVIRLILE